MIKEILLVHHTHTDIGYTHPQPVVFELHHRFIDMALDLADQAADDSDESRFRWTCEVTGTTRAWCEQASNSDRDRFIHAVRRGQMEVAAMEWHLTPLADLRMLVRSLENVRFFRDLGVPVRNAMNTDVNGVPWGLVDTLLDHGIDGFSMASNSHLGAPVSPRPGAFKWRSPSGRDLTVWNGFQYWHVANVLMRMPNSVEEVAKAMPTVLAEAEKRGYPLAYLPIQITNPHHPDNATPDPSLGRFIREWNGRDPEVRIRTILLSEIFNRLREEDLPVLSGDWTDYWNLGAGSSSRETTVLMEGLRTLDAAHNAAAQSDVSERREADNLDAAHENLALYAEHTWGADCSISAPESVETHIQWSMKSAYAYRGLAHARIVLRDALHRLAQEAGGQEPTVLVYNPLSVPVRVPMRLPVEHLGWPLTPGVHHRQRLDGALGNLPPSATRWCNVDIPALGYRTYAVDSVPLADSAGLETSSHRIRSSRVQIQFAEEGGVSSLLIDGKEFVGAVEGLAFGVPVLERPAGGSRRDIMKLDFSLFEPAEGWQKDWPRTLTQGKLTQCGPRQEDGVIEYAQEFAMENGGRVTVVYRLFADDPTVDIETILDSAGDSKPYSLALPFTLPEAGQTTWHFDTAGALVEFDKEQLPDACRHYVTARRFVRMQTGDAAFSIATPDLPLWKFGGMFFAPTSQLNPEDRKPAMLAWLSNNYWEVNFLANQTGQTRYRFRLIPHLPEPVADSYLRALPHAFPPRLHAYRELGPFSRTEGSLFHLEGDGVLLESIWREEGDMIVTLSNLRENPTVAILRPETLTWERMSYATMDGNPGIDIAPANDGSWPVRLPARGLVTVRLSKR